MPRRLITPKGKQSRIEGMAELVEHIERMQNRMTGAEVKKVYMKGAIIIRDEAKRLCPVGPDRPGHIHLRDAIFATPGPASKQNVMVGVNFRKAPHAHMVEFGTSKMAARPYMRPALAYERNYAVSVIADGLRRIIAGESV